MSSPYAPPPVETPDVVPPNVVPAPRAPMRTLVLWVLLVLLLYAAYRVLAVPSPTAPRADPPAGHPIGWAVPAATYGALLIGLWWLRRRLPAQFRTGELREVEQQALTPAAQTAAAHAPAAPIDLTLEGRDPSRPVRLHIDDGGLHWHAPKRLLLAAQELHIGWSDLESLVVVRRMSGLAVWIVVVGGVVTLGSSGAMRVAAGAMMLAALVGVLTLGRRTGTLIVGTSTHALQFSSRALDPQTEERIVLAARARAPHAVRADAAGAGGTWRALLWEPFVLLAGQFRSDAEIHAEMVRGGATPIDADTTRASTLQWRMFALWAGVLRAAGPLSLGIGLAVVTGGLGALLWATVLGAVVGLVVMARANTLFARLTGMSVVRRRVG